MIEISKNVVIIGVAVWLLACALRGYYVGFLRELYGIAQLVLALVCLWAALQKITALEGGIMSFGGFLVCIFVFRWVGRLLGIVDHIPILGGINRTLGVLVGFFKGVFLLALVYGWLGSSILIQN